MRHYETLYIINPNLSDEDYQDTVTKFSGRVEKNGGVIIKVDEWGKKTLAYEVKKFNKGYYVLLQFCGDASIPDELKRDLKMDDRVLKYQTIKLNDNVDPDDFKEKPEESTVDIHEDAGAKEDEGKPEKEEDNGL